MSTMGRLIDVEQFADMILKTDADGRLVRLRDVANIELGAQGYDQTCTLDGQPSVALSIYQLPGSNALDIARHVRDKMEELKGRFPDGLDYAIVYDTTPFINESINEVFKTLRDAVILVAVVVLLFLQNWRSAIIPLVAVPVAIIGTFAVMAAMGFSLNNLTLFGLVLAIGIVVDDAIVVVEAVEHHIEHGLSPRGRDARGDEQVSGPVDRRRPGAQRRVRAVRLHHRHHRPVLPPVRPDHRRLDVISAFNSLTLSPALTALLLGRATRRRAPPLPRLAFAAGRRLAGLRVPDAAGCEQFGRRGCALRRSRPEVACAGRRRRAGGRGRLVRGPAAELAARAGSSAASTRLRLRRPASTPGSSACCCASACWCWSSTAACWP